MIPIQFDFSDLAEEFSMSRETVDDLIDFSVKEIAAKFATLWEDEASEKLTTSRSLYMRSIIVSDPGRGMAAVELTNDVPNMIESGAEPYDMKPILLGGSKVKTSENGSKYTTIPFSIGTPGALKENFSTIMPQPVYDAILAKPQDVPVAGGVRSKGLEEGEIPSPYDKKITKKVPVPKSKAFDTYTHKSSIYQGIIRQRSDVTGQNSYISFRRVSENSDPMSWIHPGFTARNLADSALDKLDIAREAGKATDRYLIQFGYADS